jgi:hypothetical protein
LIDIAVSQSAYVGSASVLLAIVARVLAGPISINLSTFWLANRVLCVSVLHKAVGQSRSDLERARLVTHHLTGNAN